MQRCRGGVDLLVAALLLGTNSCFRLTTFILRSRRHFHSHQQQRYQIRLSGAAGQQSVADSSNDDESALDEGGDTISLTVELETSRGHFRESDDMTNRLGQNQTLAFKTKTKANDDDDDESTRNAWGVERVALEKVIHAALLQSPDITGNKLGRITKDAADAVLELLDDTTPQQDEKNGVSNALDREDLDEMVFMALNFHMPYSIRLCEELAEVVAEAVLQFLQERPPKPPQDAMSRIFRPAKNETVFPIDD